MGGSVKEDRTQAPLGAPLIGRERASSALADAWARAFSGDGCFVLLTGEPGMGKTRLASDIAARARGDGALVAWGRCWESGGAPAYWPWIQIIRSLIDELKTDDLLAFMGEGAAQIKLIAPEIGKLSVELQISEQETEDRFQLFDAMTAFLKNVARSRPLVLILEDLHAADEGTLHLLQFVVRFLQSSRLLVLATYFEAEAARSPAIGNLLAEISRDGQRIHLMGLTKEETTLLYKEITGQEPPQGVISVIHDATAGNPFFVDEMIRLLTTEGDVHRPDHSLGFRVPEGAREVVRGRLVPLSNEVTKVLSIGAVLGREFNLSTLASVTGMDANTLLDPLGEAIAAGIIKEVSALGRYAFSHVLIRETLYEDLTAADRMRLHGEIAQTLEEQYGDNADPYLAELAHHYFKAAQAGDAEKTIDYSVRAAEAALSVAAPEQAVRLYERALKVADLAGVSPARRKKITNSLRESERRALEPAPIPVATAKSGECVFTRKGDYWTITFDGETSLLKDIKGLGYLARLLASPGLEFHALDLAGAPVGDHAAARTAATEDELGLGWGDAGEVLDDKAKAQYRARLQDLQDQFEEAKAFNDPERAARAQEEIDALVQQLAAGVGLGGRDRRAVSAAERARISVFRALKSAIDRIHESNPSLGRHLRTTVKTGVYCSYTPDDRSPIEWQL